MLALGALNHGFNPQLGHGKLLSPTSLMFQTNRCGTKVYGLCLYISGFSLYSWLSSRGFKQTDVLPKFMLYQLYEETNLAAYFLDNKCNRAIQPYNNRWSQGNY
jgi:hypothetical protein